MDVNSYREEAADLKKIAFKILDEIENDFSQSEINFTKEKNKVIIEKNREIDDLREAKDAEIKAMRNAVLKAIQ